jgi:hypothetical protein
MRWGEFEGGEHVLEMQADMRVMRHDVTEITRTLLVLNDGHRAWQLFMRIERDMVHVKRLLGQMDGPIAHLEGARPAANGTEDERGPER